MKVRILGNVRHDNVNLKKYEVYDLPEEDAKNLIASKDATLEGIDNQTQVREYTPKKNKVDAATGMRVPGEFEDVKAQEPKNNANNVQGVEPPNPQHIQGANANQGQNEDPQKKGV